MPRLKTSLLRHARAINPLLPLLLRTCRTIPSAHNELRWLREHVNERLLKKFGSAKDVPERLRHRCVADLVRRRGRGEPLQYLLGSQPFGDLDIKCRKGVLIPRQCTEAYTERLGRVIKDDIQSLTIAPKRVRIIDFCTGTGCIPLLLLSLLTKSLPDIQPDVSGIDISPTALKLATKNYHRNISRFGDEASKRQVHTRLGSPKGEAMDGPHSSAPSIIFEHANLLNVKAKISEANAGRMGVGESDDVFTIITCNPPYISKAAFAQQTERSVRNYEPKLALTPHVDSTKFTRPKLAMAMAPNVDIIEFSKPRVALSPDMEPEDLAEMVFNWVRVEDVFYVAVAERAMKLAARVMLLEVGSTEQACRVAQQVIDRSKSMYGDGFMMAPSSYWEVVEIWGDEPDAEVEEVLGVDKEEREELEETFGVKFRGKGVGRSIYFRRFEKPYELVDSGIDFVDLREDLEERKERLYWERKEVEDRRKEAEVILEGTKE